MELQDLLGHKVDIVTERGLRERIRERVLKEAIPLWEIYLSDYVIFRMSK